MLADRSRLRFLTVSYLIAGLIGTAIAGSRAGAEPALRPPSQADPAHWYRVSNPATGSLRAVDMVSSDVAWAVSMSSMDGPGQVLVFRDGTWQAASTHRNVYLMSIDMLSATEGWAVGYELGETTRSVLLPIRSGRVGPVERTPCHSLYDVQLLSPSEGWAVGSGGDDGKAMCIAHLQNGSWSAVPSPGAGLLIGVEMVDAERGWAVGWEGTTLLYGDGAWREVPGPESPDTPAGYLDFALMDMDHGWAVGGVGPSTLRLADGRWNVVDTGFDIVLGGVDMLSGDLAFAAGRARAGATDKPFVLRFQDGGWREEDLSRASADIGLLDVDMIAPDDGWAVGFHNTLRYGVPPWSTAAASPTALATLDATPIAVPTGPPSYLPALLCGARFVGITSARR